MKAKRIRLYRPEFEVEANLFGRLYLFFNFYKLIKIKRCEFTFDGKAIRSTWMVCIPKVKVVDST